MQVEITIKVLGEKDESAAELLSRVGGLLKNQPTICVEHVAEKPVTPPEPEVKKSKEPAREEPEYAEASEAVKKKRGRPRKDETQAPQKPLKAAKPEPEPEDDEEDNQDAWELEEIEETAEAAEESDEDDFEFEDEKPKKTKAELKAAKANRLTLEGDIIPAFRKFTSEKGNSAGAEVLRKFEVQSVRDLSEDDYPAVLTAIAEYKPAVKRRPKQ